MGFTEAAWTLMSNSPELGVGRGHLRTGALPARHSCGLALLSCFPFQISPWARHYETFYVQVGVIGPFRWLLRRERLSRNAVCICRHKLFEQRLELRSQVQFFALLLKQPTWIGGGFQCVAQV